MSDCAGCYHPEKYGHNAYCPESRIDELKARLAEVEKDAERYRYIRDNAKEGAVTTLLPLYRSHYFISLEPVSECPTFGDAIDAAILASKGGAT